MMSIESIVSLVYLAKNKLFMNTIQWNNNTDDDVVDDKNDNYTPKQNKHSKSITLWNECLAMPSNRMSEAFNNIGASQMVCLTNVHLPAASNCFDNNLML